MQSSGYDFAYALKASSSDPPIATMA